MLVNDHPVVRIGYRSLLESMPDMRIVVKADNGKIDYKIYQELQPDVTILDINMPGIGEIETIRRIKTKDPVTRILVFSMLKNATLAQSTLKARATGFISKRSGIREMIHALPLISKEKSYIESELTTALTRYTTEKNNYENPFDSLPKQ